MLANSLVPLSYIDYFLDPPNFLNLHRLCYDPIPCYRDLRFVTFYGSLVLVLTMAAVYGLINSFSAMMIFTAIILFLTVYSFILRPYILFLTLSAQGVPCAPYRHFNFFNWRGSSLSSNPLKSGSGGQRYSGLFLNQIGPYPRLVLSDPTLAVDILKGASRHWVKGEVNQKIFGGLFGAHGVLTAEEPEHTKDRNVIQRFFQYGALIETQGFLLESSLAAYNSWASKGQAIPIYHEIARLTMSMVAAIAFGDALDHKRSDALIHHIERGLQLSQTRFDSIYPIIPVLRHLPTALNRQLFSEAATLDKLCEEIIANRSSKRTQPLFGSSDPLEELLSADIEHSTVLSHMKTILFAGHDTTANTLLWALVELQQQPAILQALTEEIDTLVQDGPIESFSINEPLSSFRYLDAVLKETMRIYCPVPANVRQAVRKHTIGPQQAPLTIYPGVHAIVHLPRLHKNSKYFLNPGEFRPSRWLNNEEKPPPNAFLPFGLGARSCLGQQLALIQSKVALIAFVKYFRFHLAPGQNLRPTMNCTTAPADIIMATISRRERKEE